MAMINQATNSTVTTDEAYANPFAIACYAVMSMLFGEVPTKGQVGSFSQHDADYEVVAAVGVTGGVRGHCVFGMSTETALGVTSAMAGSPATELDELALSAVSELANMICGNGLLQLTEMFGDCDLTPPTIMCGDGAVVSSVAITPTIIPLTLSFGSIDLVVGLVAKES